MKKSNFAVMGKPISHSLSPRIHQLFAEALAIELHYEKIEIDLDHFEQQVQLFFEKGGKGLNITLPGKQRAFAMADIRSNRSLQAKAANTLWQENGLLHADNTDGVGFMRDLNRYFNVAHKKILVLGAGGAAAGILGPLLAAQPANITIANRTLEKAQQLNANFNNPCQVCPSHELHDAFDLIINTTAASLSQESIILPEITTRHHPFCYDLAYQLHEPTVFVAWAQSLRCPAVDGLGMLVEQAAESFYLWHQKRPETVPVLEMLRQMSN